MTTRFIPLLYIAVIIWLGLCVTQSTKERHLVLLDLFNNSLHYFSSCQPYLKDIEVQVANVLWLMNHSELMKTKATFD